ncbi:hypothetical protein G6F43_007867 [Rhizopus delemar]|nr:hypothetical protein G6F43_007867 [Rhizopus delemar]
MLFEVFRATKRGRGNEFGREAKNNEAYHWRGRSPGHTLTSGLDDYPRGKSSDIAHKLGVEDDLREYNKVQEDLLINLEALHWNEDQQMYCDQALEPEKFIHVCHKCHPSYSSYSNYVGRGHIHQKNEESPR